VKKPTGAQLTAAGKSAGKAATKTAADAAHAKRKDAEEAHVSYPLCCSFSFFVGRCSNFVRQSQAIDAEYQKLMKKVDEVSSR
jgi:hypothetical protein